MALIRATRKQIGAYKEITVNNESVHKAMLKAGYTPGAASRPKNLTESKGFLALCDEIGLTDEFLNQALRDDIEGKPRNRVSELNLAYKIRGRLKESESGSNFTPATVNIAIINPDSPSPEPSKPE